MSVESALESLRHEPGILRNVVHWAHIPACPARVAPFPPGVDARLEAALAARGVTAPYTHQAAAVAAALRGEHVAVVTPAASGKTLCYNLPVLTQLLADCHARALYLFPTKALAQDQLAELNDLLGWLPASGAAQEGWSAGTESRRPARGQPGLQRTAGCGITCAVYDGDTPSSVRASIREGARVVLSNPDMLHAGILPQHARWATFFANLRTVVIDEMHVYRGVFGSHMANVLRRLRRICQFHGSHPQFLLASATIANPADLATRLVEAPVTVIGPEQNGAPQGPKEILFYNPPMADPALGIRRSSSLEAVSLAAHFLRHGAQTIVFAPARLTAELILAHLRDAAAGEAAQGVRSRQAGEQGMLAEGAPDHPPSAIRGYRGGYLPAQRREIERGLRDGQVRCVVATNALELGIDIGGLDVALLAGYPGTIASTRQQMGRSGRRQAMSAAVLVAGAGPLDQYIVAHPDYLLAGSPEHALINPDNAVILAAHLACAAAELPIQAGERLGAAPDLEQHLADLVEAGQLYRAGDRYYWAGEGSPAAGLSLRSTSADRVIIQSTDVQGRPLVIGELDRFSVPLLAYQGAIYLHEGISYLVERLDWEAGIATVRPVEADFYTRPSIAEHIEIIAERGSASGPPAATATRSPDSRLPEPRFRSAWGDVRVVSQASGYRILRRGTNEVLGFGQIDLPEQVLETQACWLELAPALIEGLRGTGEWLSDPNEYGPEWPARREAVRARDGYRCQACGAPEPPGQQHDVHHRIPFRAFLADPNLRGGVAPAQAWQAANRLDNLVTLCAACHRRAEATVRTRSGLGGLAALLAGVAPLRLMCDPRDLGTVVEPRAPDSGLPTITIYERVPFGVGYAEEICRSMPMLLGAALALVSGCPCESGCPACVGPVLLHEYALDAKALTVALLTALCR